MGMTRSRRFIRAWICGSIFDANSQSHSTAASRGLRGRGREKPTMIRWSKVALFVACLAPLARLGWKAYAGRLGANPIEVITHSTGDWTMIFLLVTLAITPLRKMTGQPWMIRYRRMLGLFAFFYGTLHLVTYVWLDKFFAVHEMLADIAKRRFITMGLLGFVLMLPLAITSTSGWIRRLGGR